MKAFTLCGLAVLAALGACSRSTHTQDQATGPVDDAPPAHAAAVLIAQGPKPAPRPPYRFSKDDEELLDAVQRGAFSFLWNECGPTGMVVDRTSEPVVSIAGVGFQLAALPIGVERRWITRAQGSERATTILRALEQNPRNRKYGFFYHFLEPERADPLDRDSVSTIDSAIFFAGALVAGSYFGGEVRERADRLYGAADWSAFVERTPRPHEPHMKGFLSLGWKPKNGADPTGDGAMLPYYWADSGDEHRLVMFLAAAAPEERHRVDAAQYYRLRRPLGVHPASGLHVYLPWSGALFTNVFAHCFIDYASMGPDDPGAFGAERRARVDWWENSRRAVLFNRARCIEEQARWPNLGADSWGLTACDGPKGYLVPGVYPRPVTPGDALKDVDYPVWEPKDELGGGVIAPYGAGCAVMFEPGLAMRALRHYRGLVDHEGRPLVWREPGKSASERAGYGFQDSFDAPAGWAARDCVSIDQGPLVLAIENARSGGVWRWFHAHPWIAEGVQRLGMRRGVTR